MDYENSTQRNNASQQLRRCFFLPTVVVSSDRSSWSPKHISTTTTYIHQARKYCITNLVKDETFITMSLREQKYYCSHTLLTHIQPVPTVQRTSNTVCKKGWQLFMSLFSTECLRHSLSCRFEETNIAVQLRQPAQSKPSKYGAFHSDRMTDLFRQWGISKDWVQNALQRPQTSVHPLAQQVSWKTHSNWTSKLLQTNAH